MTTSELTPEAQDQLKNAVDVALASPTAAKGFLNNIPDLSALGGVGGKVVTAIDGVLAALETVLQYKWIIPDKYEDPLEKLVQALTKVKGWLD